MGQRFNVKPASADNDRELAARIDFFNGAQSPRAGYFSAFISSVKGTVPIR